MKSRNLQRVCKGTRETVGIESDKSHAGKLRLRFSTDCGNCYANVHLSRFTTVFGDAMTMNHHSPPIIGCSAPTEKMRHQIDRVAATDLAVMIRGEKGSGKDVVAGEIHRKSNRAAGPFIRVNARALPRRSRRPFHVQLLERNGLAANDSGAGQLQLGTIAANSVRNTFPAFSRRGARATKR